MLRFLAQTSSDFTEYNDFTTTTTTQADTAFLGIGLATIFLLSLVFYVVGAVIYSFVFKKAGRPMWAAWVPIYNGWVLFEIAGKPGWWILSSFIPFLGSIIYLVLWVIAMLELAKRFGKSTAFSIFGLILFHLIGMIMLAFGKSTYNASDLAYGQVGVSGNIDPPYPAGDNDTLTNAASVQSQQDISRSTAQVQSIPDGTPQSPVEYAQQSQQVVRPQEYVASQQPLQTQAPQSVQAEAQDPNQPTPPPQNPSV